MNQFINDNLLPDNIIRCLCEDVSQSRQWYDFLKKYYQEKTPDQTLKEKDPEDSLCNIWLAPILQKLGWHFSAQQKTFSWEGKDNKIDFSLYPSSEEAASIALPLTFLEAKKWELPLAKEPYSQTMRYIRALQGHTGRTIIYGLLSNGKAGGFVPISARARKLPAVKLNSLILSKMTIPKILLKRLLSLRSFSAGPIIPASRQNKTAKPVRAILSRLKKIFAISSPACLLKISGNTFMPILKVKMGQILKPILSA